MAQNHPGDFAEFSGQLSTALEAVDFPADKSTILQVARSNQLEPSILSTLEKLPDRDYQDLRDVLDHFTGGTQRVPTKQEQSRAESSEPHENPDLTGLRQGTPAPQDSGSRNVRDIPPHHNPDH